jgi:hypothetical protein
MPPDDDQEQSSQCPLFDCEGTPIVTYDPAHDHYMIRCTNCGQFLMSGTFYPSAAAELSKHPGFMAGLRAYIRKENEKSPSVAPTICSSTWLQMAINSEP